MKTFLRLRYELFRDHPVLSWVSTKENMNKGTFVLWAAQFGVFGKLMIAYPNDGTYMHLENGEPVIKKLPFPKAQKPHRIVVHQKGFPHGKATGYQYGCRCQKCTSAAAEKMRQ